jgi:2'-5' RNA ligase
MSSKTYWTAVVAIPPEAVWGPIQAIRQRHDRHVRRWMPHVNLLYPFYRPDCFAEAVPRLAAACASITPNGLTLAQVRFFRHASGTATLWPAPEPAEPVVRLQAALQAACPDCDDQSRFPAGFTPHLSVGQAGSADEARRLIDGLQVTWQPIRFELSAIALIQRGRESPFAVEHWIPFGQAATVSPEASRPARGRADSQDTG